MGSLCPQSETSNRKFNNFFQSNSQKLQRKNTVIVPAHRAQSCLLGKEAAPNRQELGNINLSDHSCSESDVHSAYFDQPYGDINGEHKPEDVPVTPNTASHNAFGAPAQKKTSILDPFITEISLSQM